MTWGQPLAFQDTVAVVYPETDDPAYRVMFESVIQSLQTIPTAPPTPGGCASEQGFSLHAEVCCAAHQRKKLDHLCPTSRAPPSPMNGSLNRAGQVALNLKTPYRDGTTHIVMSPLEFLQRLAALVPRPRLHLIRFHGVLAPEARPREEPLWRAEDAAPGYVPRSFHPQGLQQPHPCAWLPERAGQREYPLSGPRRGAPCRSAGAHELGPVVQAGVRYRPGPARIRPHGSRTNS
jgi:hypothetical protein